MDSHTFPHCETIGIQEGDPGLEAVVPATVIHSPNNTTVGKHHFMHTNLSDKPYSIQTLPSLKLPKTSHEWSLADEDMSVYVVPTVLSCSTIDEKHQTLCNGVYHYFAEKFGIQKKPVRKPKRRRSEQQRRLHNLTKQKNDAKKTLRRARKDGLDQSTIKTIAREFHKLLRLHNKESRISAKCSARLEALKARSLCAKSFWCFAARILDKEEDNISPTFTAKDAEVFRSMYSSEPRAFQRPEWLPVPPPPATPFNTDPISTEELHWVLH